MRAATFIDQLGSSKDFHREVVGARFSSSSSSSEDDLPSRVMEAYEAGVEGESNSKEARSGAQR